MRKIVILEGPDGGGKSCLAAQLHDVYGYRIVKTGPPPPYGDVTTAYLLALTDALDRPYCTVFDRLHLGEAIYGPLLRGDDKMTIDGLKVLERVIRLIGARLIIVCPPWDTLAARWRAKDDLLKTEDALRQVRDAYLGHAARLGLKPYDWTAADAEERLKEMIDA